MFGLLWGLVELEMRSTVLCSIIKTPNPTQNSVRFAIAAGTAA
jgi:hypothetical protein